MRIGVLIISLGKQHHSANVCRRPPEFRQELALNPHVLDVFRVLRGRDWRDSFAQSNAHDPAHRRINVNFPWLAVEITGLAIPVLPFAVIGRKLYGMAASQVIGLVNVQQALYVVITGGQ